MQLVVFALGNDLYAMETLSVSGITLLDTITPIPRTATYIEGITNLRGQIIPIVCLRERLGMEKRVESKDTRIIFVEVGSVQAGLLVDRVREVVTLPDPLISSVPPGTDAEHIYGICHLGDSLVSLLDIKRLFAEQLQNIV